MANPDQIGLSNDALILVDSYIKIVDLLESKVERMELENVRLKSEMALIKRQVTKIANHES